MTAHFDVAIHDIVRERAVRCGDNDKHEGAKAEGNAIHIGKGAVIYSYCIILAGSKIGEGATIAPGSLVNGEIPPYAIAMGSPARVVMQRKPED